jgi:hypothetical protein
MESRVSSFAIGGCPSADRKRVRPRRANERLLTSIDLREAVLTEPAERRAKPGCFREPPTYACPKLPKSNRPPSVGRRRARRPASE